MVTKYGHLFNGTGKIEDKKSDREILGRFHMKPEAAPVAQKPRQVPYYLQKPFRKWLDQGIKKISSRKYLMMNQLLGALLLQYSPNQSLQGRRVERVLICESQISTWSEVDFCRHQSWKTSFTGSMDVRFGLN